MDCAIYAIAFVRVVEEKLDGLNDCSEGAMSISRQSIFCSSSRKSLMKHYPEEAGLIKPSMEKHKSKACRFV